MPATWNACGLSFLKLAEFHHSRFADDEPRDGVGEAWGIGAYRHRVIRQPVASFLGDDQVSRVRGIARVCRR